MKVKEPGHVYELTTVPGDDGNFNVSKLTFLRKEKVKVSEYLSNENFSPVQIDPPDATMLRTTGGTTNEDVLAVLIDRTEFLQAQFPCQEHLDALAHMRAALERFNARTEARKAQGVEGTLANHA